MAQLKNRQMQIPNGLRFLQPETGWQSPRQASFDVIVRALIAHRRSRPDLVQKHNWSLDYDMVAAEVDAFNARLCERHGWLNYINTPNTEMLPPPKSKAPPLQERKLLDAAAGRAKKIWTGVRTISDFIASGAPTVDQKLAEQRAAICAACPHNGKGDFTSWFTAPAAGAIKRQIEAMQERKITTSQDDKLGTCDICYCAMRVKVHFPIEFIAAHTSGEVMDEFRKVPHCWVHKEIDAVE